VRCLVLIFCCQLVCQLALAGPDKLQTCLDIAKQQADGTLDLKKQCPDLFNDLQNQGRLDGFEPPLQDGVSLAQLAFLADSTQGLQKLAPINQSGLGQLLAGILVTEPNDPETDWWQAILKCLDSLKTGEYETEYNWLVHFLEAINPSEQALRLFLYGSIALLVIISAWLVVSELVRAGVFNTLLGPKKPVFEPKFNPKQSFQQSIGQQSIRELPAQRQIAALLEQAVVALAKRGLIPTDPALTHRQILCAIGQENSGLNSSFAHLVQKAEPILFGNRPVDEQTLRHCWRDAQALLGRPIS
jgi:Domain of unknown function (DUF4129)